MGKVLIIILSYLQELTFKSANYAGMNKEDVMDPSDIHDQWTSCEKLIESLSFPYPFLSHIVCTYFLNLSCSEFFFFWAGGRLNQKQNLTDLFCPCSFGRLVQGISGPMA